MLSGPMLHKVALSVRCLRNAPTPACFHERVRKVEGAQGAAVEVNEVLRHIALSCDQRFISPP